MHVNVKVQNKKGECCIKSIRTCLIIFCSQLISATVKKYCMVWWKYPILEGVSNLSISRRLTQNVLIMSLKNALQELKFIISFNLSHICMRGNVKKHIGTMKDYVDNWKF